MRKTIAIAMTLTVGASATAVGAAALLIPAKWYGSDTLFVVTQKAIDGDPNTAGQSNNYLAGGSGAGQGAMANASLANATQQTAPMSRMMSSGVCGTASTAVLGVNNGTSAANGSGIVIGMDAVSVFSSTTSGTAAACSTAGSDAQTTDGLVASGSTGVFAGSTAMQNWKWALALVYGGLDLSVPGSQPDCGSAARANLVNNWSSLFQNGCANGSSVCNDAPHKAGGSNPVLWHAFRRDDGSGTSDVFSSIIGLQVLMPSTSASSNNGFGASPYCNSLNWDTNTASNVPGCNLPPNDQFVGPGGVKDPASTCTFTDFKSADLKVAETCGAAGSGNHRRPPPGTYGDNPISTIFTGADVLPTSFQDNDPLRRTCLGVSAGLTFNSGEEVCNLDGKLGLVLAIPSADFIQDQLGKVQYPTNVCNTFEIAKAPKIFNCAPSSAGAHSGECPNGDALVANGCLTPVDTVTGTSQCFNTKSKFASLTNRPLGAYDGRRHNLAMPDGDLNNGTIAYFQDAIQNGKAVPPTVDFIGGMGRIHSVQTIWDTSLANPPNAGCQMKDATDQIACLTQADPCSVGYAGDGGKSWDARPNGTVCANLVTQGVCTGSGAGGTQPPYSGSTCPAACVSQGSSSPTLVADSIRVDFTYPTATNVQALGTQHVEYQIARKLYYNSLVGFGNVANTTADPGAAGELDIAKWESVPANIDPILASIGYFPLSPTQHPNGVDGTGQTNPFCEDFNQGTVCADHPANDNACNRNPAGVPSDPSAVAASATTSTVCGNGVQEAYEECDHGATNGASGDTCSLTCRCAGTTTYAFAGGVWGCQ